MNELRWILLGLGLLLIVIIYLTSRRRSHVDTDTDDDEMLQEPRLGSVVDSDDLADDIGSSMGDAQSLPALEEAVDPPVVDRDGQLLSAGRAPQQEPSVSETDVEQDSTPAPVVMEKVVALHLVPRAGTLFGGVEFINALKAEGLKYDRFDIFHRFPVVEQITDSTPSLFSVANLIKPGTFNMRGLERQEFKGASMFLVLPGPEDPVAAFMDMVATGRRLAATLEGQLLDSDGTHLSRQRASHLREEIVNYQHGISVQSNAPA